MTTPGFTDSMISIHALRKESDIPNYLISSDFVISIHALRKESDRFRDDVQSGISISIHALRKESDMLAVSVIAACVIFQSTLSVRRATLCALGMFTPYKNFNPRSP